MPSRGLHGCLFTLLVVFVAASAAPGQTPVSLPPCCGQRMTLEGDVGAYRVPEGKTPDGTVVPIDCRVELGTQVMVAKADLPAGDYTIEVTGSENSFKTPGQRIFSITVGTGPDKIVLAKDLDLFTAAGGMGKSYTATGTVKHPGGPLKVAFTATRDNAKFSVIRILDAKKNKVAWLFAEDWAEFMKLPGQPPVVAGPMIWRDASQQLEKRVADLVRRMTLQEKVLQLRHNAPAIERLNLPAYNYWSEGLHGVARNGQATVFPQAIGMAASWDPELMQNVGDTISTEARAKFNAARQKNDAEGNTYQGLTFWSPNINLFRDPRWGRGQETYGEDPYLTGTMAVAFIKGLQGNDPKYLKVVATAKHYAVHSGPESLRHVFDAAPPERDFYESYLPHFEMAVREAHVFSIMGAYNRVYGAPACASDLLLKNLLRKDWGFGGYVVSDCGAIGDIWAYHRVTDNAAEASAAAILAGCDLECGGNYASLAAAVELNLIGEGAIDNALSRILTSRFKLGLFDPPTAVPYAQIPATENETPQHAALALRMARESMVLLKNDGILPLPKTLKKLAVVGPNADGLLPLLGNYNGTPTAPVTILEGLRAALPNAQITYIRGYDNALRTGALQPLPDVCVQSGGESGFHAEYFNNEDLSGKPKLVRTDKAINFRDRLEWLNAGLPIGGYSPLSVRWTGDFVAPKDGEYKLALTGRPGNRVIINGKTLADSWDDLTQPPVLITMTLKAGQPVPLRIECHQPDTIMLQHLLWDRGDLDLAPQIVERVKDAEAILFVGGLDGHMEAEEGDIRADFEGFTGGDRLAIELPPQQTALIKALAATGKPVIFINLTGSAVAIPWEAEHLKAILQAWYPGQAGGKAVADVLFGDYNPAGRLPITFYKATEDLPDFTDYAMKNRTYRYYAGAPLWSFGHGLSYSQFRYTSPTLSAATAGAADKLQVGVDVANLSQRDGDEVVQVYVRPVAPKPGDAQQRLVAFRRIPIPAGKTVHVQVPLSVAALRNWDPEKKAYFVPPGDYMVEIGAASSDIRASRPLNIK